jgi:hypothetical protein
MKQSTEGARHFSEIVEIARQLTIDVKDVEARKQEISRLTKELLTYQCNRPVVTLTVY